MNGMFGIDCSSPSATDYFVCRDVGFHPTLYFASPSETRSDVSATAETASKLSKLNVFVCILDGIVKNKYANNPGKLAAWISASHVEKAQTPTP